MSDANGWPDASKPGVPQNPERDGWHWLRRADGFTAPYRWRPGKHAPRNGSWLYPPDWELMPEDREIYRQIYLGPCLTPDEVAAREAAAAEAMRGIAAETAREACLVPPDGGSPNADEVEVCDEAERRIRALPFPAADALARAIEDERLNPWKAAVINAMICFEDLPSEDETPREALNRHIAREQEVALDPAVSQAARDLLDQARAEERDACALIADRKAVFAAAGGPHKCSNINGALWFGRQQYAEEIAADIRARGKEPQHD